MFLARVVRSHTNPQLFTSYLSCFGAASCPVKPRPWRACPWLPLETTRLGKRLCENVTWKQKRKPGILYGGRKKYCNCREACHHKTVVLTGQSLPPFPPKSNVGVCALVPPSERKQYCNSTLDFGGEGGKREGFQCMCCFMGGLASNRPTLQYLFHPPTGQKEIR